MSHVNYFLKNYFKVGNKVRAINTFEVPLLNSVGILSCNKSDLEDLGRRMREAF